MSRVLCFSYERLFYPNNILSGPGSRIWELACALKRKKHKVTIAELNHEKDYEKDGIKFISWDTQKLKNIKKEFDVAFILLSAYVGQYFSKIPKIPTIVDLTTPIAVEAQAHSIGRNGDFFLNDGILPTYIALENGDFFTCSNQAQKNYYSGMMALMGIKNFNKDIIKVCPFAPSKKYIKTKKKNILTKVVGKNKKILLWMGSMFSWYDYKTPILAMKNIVKTHKNAALIFVGADNPNIPELTKNNYKKAKNLAKKHKLLDKSIYFIDWVAYNDRLSIYTESYLNLVTSNNSPESSLSYRTRIVDSFQARLPVICTDNDDLSKIIENNSLGETIPVSSPKVLASKIIRLVEDTEKVRKYSKNIDNYVKKVFNIDESIKPIHDFCKKPKSFEKEPRLNFLSIINQQNQRIKNLEYIKDDKEGVNQSLVNEIKRLEKIKESDWKDFERIKDAQNEHIQEIKKTLDETTLEMKMQMNRLNEIIKQQGEIIAKQKGRIGQFKNSIMYPFFRVTHNIGRTKMGKILQKLLK